uniref:Uncharacterized protein n=1 Tax=viral metagenome TaxID=1070528 RepID=A0A6H1ZGS5_9ZZZZ
MPGNPKGVGRPKGAKDLRPRITAKRKLVKSTPDQILGYKLRILEMLEKGEAYTLTACAEKLGVPALRVYHWSCDDKEFQEMVHLAQEVQADKLEQEFIDLPERFFIPKMMLLKAWRPMYRDNYKVDITNTKLEQMLEELKQIGQKQEGK